MRFQPRVLIPEGRIGLTFWGRPERNGLLPYLLKAMELSPASDVAASMEQDDTRNVIVDLLRAMGFGDVEQGPTCSLGVTSRLEARIGEIEYPTECMLPWSA